MDGFEFTPDCDTFTNLPAETQQQVIDTTAFVLWSLSGRRFGQETGTVRPVQPMPPIPTNVRRFGQGRSAFDMEPFGVPALSALMFGPRITAIRLRGPISEIEQVMVNGEVIPPEAYTTVGADQLLRIDGGGWPAYQSIASPATEIGTFAVTYTWGAPLPPSGQAAAALYACELAKARVGDETCQLPERVTKISREGIDVQFLDPTDFITEGRTGIPAVDQWLKAVNPYNQPAPADVWSPDLPVNYRVGS